MPSERRSRFGGIDRAEIDFHGTRREPGEVDAVGLEIVGREGEAGAAPIFARRGEIAHGDDDSFDTNYAHVCNLGARLSSVNAGCHGRESSAASSAESFICVILVMIIDVQASMLTL